MTRKSAYFFLFEISPPEATKLKKLWNHICGAAHIVHLHLKPTADALGEGKPWAGGFRWKLGHQDLFEHAKPWGEMV